MASELVTITLVERSDDDESEHLVELLMTPAQARAYQERRFVPAYWLGHPDEVFATDSLGRPCVQYDVSEQPIPSELEDFDD